MPTQNDREPRPLPEAESLYRRWLAHLNDEFGRHESPDPRSEIVRDELYQLYLGRPHGNLYRNDLLTSDMATLVLRESLDPRNATLASEYLADLDPERYAPRKPLIWFWRMFDRSPLGANLWLGLRLRYMLGRHIFQALGEGVKIYPGVEFTFGYNLTIEDNCTIHAGALLDDRSELILRAGTTVDAGVAVSTGRKN
jgi:hypothetical protein